MDHGGKLAATASGFRIALGHNGRPGIRWNPQI